MWVKCTYDLWLEIFYFDRTFLIINFFRTMGVVVCPGPVAPLVGAPSRIPKGWRIHVRSGRVPRFQVQSPVWARMWGNWLMILSHINVSFPLPKINFLNFFILLCFVSSWCPYQETSKISFSYSQKDACSRIRLPKSKFQFYHIRAMWLWARYLACLTLVINSYPTSCGGD